MSLFRSMLIGLVAAAVLVLAGCAPIRQVALTPTPSAALPDTQAQQALVRTYIALVAAERFAEAWQLLAPERQRNESSATFAADWRAWGRVQPDCNTRRLSRTVRWCTAS